MRKYYLESCALLKLAIPVLIAQTSQSAIGFIDTVMAGRVSATDTAAVATAGSIWLPAILFSQGIFLALTALIAQLNGAGQRQKIVQQVWQGFWLAGLVSLPLMILLYQSQWIFRLMPQQMEPQLAELTVRYLQAILWGVPGYFIYLVLRCLCEGLSKTKPSMVIGFIGLLVNIPINYIFIYGAFNLPALGSVGCGVATAIVYWVLFLLLLGYILRDAELRALKIFSHFEWPNFNALWCLIKLGLPSGLAHFLEGALFAVAALLIAPLGAEWVAGHQIALNFSTLVFMIPFSIGMAVSIRVGHRLGEKLPAEAKKAAYTGLAIGLLMAVMSAIFSILLRYEIAALYCNDATVLAIAAQLMLLAAIFQCSDAIQVIINGILRGYNDTFSIFVISFVAFWLLGFPCSYILGLTDWIVPALGAWGIWIGFIISLTISAILFILRMLWIQYPQKMRCFIFN